jgi:DNA polymerase-3 subunit alpha
MNYISLHNHSEYSVLDGLPKDKEYIQRAKEFRMDGISITNHGNLNNYSKVILECKKENIKPILGVEFYYVPSIKNWKEKKENLDNDKSLIASEKKKKNKEISKRNHLIVLAKNNEGFKNLCKLNYESSLAENFYFRPRIDFEMLCANKEGLIISTACIAGEIQQMIINKIDSQLVLKKIEEYKEIFGKDFYFEIQLLELEEQKFCNYEMINYSKKLNIPVIITTDSHYLKKEDQKTHQTLLLMNSKSTYEDLQKKQQGEEISGSVWEFGTKELYLKSYEQLKEAKNNYNPEISDKDFDMFCENTYEILSKISDYGIDTKPKMKDILPEVEDKTFYIRNKCYQELKRKFLYNEQYLERLEYELNVLREKGFNDYTLTIAKIIEIENEKGNITAPGRGSGAGSLVNYLMKITKIDPIKWNLSFERYLDINSCLCEDMFVSTEKGFKKIKDIILDDKIENINGGFSNIEKITKKDVSLIYKVYFENDFIECSGEHKFLVKRDEKEELIMAKDLKETDFLICEKYCKCGCGNKIEIKSHHGSYGVPDFLHGHNLNIKEIRDNFLESLGIKVLRINKKDLNDFDFDKFFEVNYGI